MSEERYVTEEQLHRHCQQRHGNVDKSLDVLFEKVDRLVNQVYEIAKELKTFGNRFYLVVIIALLGVISTLFFQDKQPLEIRIVQEREGIEVER